MDIFNQEILARKDILAETTTELVQRIPDNISPNAHKLHFPGKASKRLPQTQQ